MTKLVTHYVDRLLTYRRAFSDAAHLQYSRLPTLGEGRTEDASAAAAAGICGEPMGRSPRTLSPDTPVATLNTMLLTRETADFTACALSPGEYETKAH